jgi:hypothetical protein
LTEVEMEMRLDGNAAGGSLREIFAMDLTAAIVTCNGCGAEGPVGGLFAYGQPMGVVLRCPHCDSVVLRCVRTPGSIRLEMMGARVLVIDERAPVA